MKKTILIVDDEQNIREGLRLAVEMKGYKALTAEDGLQAWNLINIESIDMVVTDLKMPKMTGEELLKKVFASYPTLPVVVLTGHGTIEDAVNAMQNGAVDFITKPVNLDHLFILIEKTLSNRDMVEKNKELQKEVNVLKSHVKTPKLIGNSAVMQNLMSTVETVASTKASVLITGESGVGKELIADAIVANSDRSDKPFIKVHCASLNSNLLESELFGHVKGSFTGAVSDTKGRFEMANSGTIFLDEIGEIDLSTQVKLLRVIQEKEFVKVGGQNSIKTDVRIIAATNRNLEEEIKKGTFREDLYYRLNVVRLEVPPLRERKSDITSLTASFIDEFANENGKTIKGMTAEVKNVLFNYSWPGNIRELRNCIESAVIMCKTGTITIEDLPHSMQSVPTGDSNISIPLFMPLYEAEKTIILSNLDYFKGNQTKTAQALGIGRSTLLRKLEEYGK